MAAIVDMEWSVTEWAAEALINDADGYYGGAHNFYLYDYPGTGYRWLICDADSSFDWFGYVNEHPIYWWIAPRTEHYSPGQHYSIVMDDPTWRGHYIDAIRTLLARWDARQDPGLDRRLVGPDRRRGRPPIRTRRSRSPSTSLAVAGMRQEVVDAPRLSRQVPRLRGRHRRRHRRRRRRLRRGATTATTATPRPTRAPTEICGNGIDDDCNGFVDDGCM